MMCNLYTNGNNVTEEVLHLKEKRTRNLPLSPFNFFLFLSSLLTQRQWGWDRGNYSLTWKRSDDHNNLDLSLLDLVFKFCDLKHLVLRRRWAQLWVWWWLNFSWVSTRMRMKRDLQIKHNSRKLNSNFSSFSFDSSKNKVFSFFHLLMINSHWTIFFNLQLFSSDSVLQLISSPASFPVSIFFSQLSSAEIIKSMIFERIEKERGRKVDTGLFRCSCFGMEERKQLLETLREGRKDSDDQDFLREKETHFSSSCHLSKMWRRERDADPKVNSRWKGKDGGKEDEKEKSFCPWWSFSSGFKRKSSSLSFPWTFLSRLSLVPPPPHQHEDCFILFFPCLLLLRQKLRKSCSSLSQVRLSFDLTAGRHEQDGGREMERERIVCDCVFRFEPCEKARETTSLIPADQLLDFSLSLPLFLSFSLSPCLCYFSFLLLPKSFL